jgi:ribosome-associated protein
MTDRSSFKQKNPELEETFDGPSKSSKKREMLTLQTLGKKLAELPDRQFKSIEFSDERLSESLAFYRGIPSKKHEARRRQMQFIGKLMRHTETESLKTQLNAFEGQDQDLKRRHYQTEKWRQRLINDQTDLTNFLDEYRADSQKINQLLRAALKSISNEKDQGETKALYRALLEAVSH